MVNFKLVVLAPMFDNQGNLINIEDFYLNIVNKLEASSIAYTIGSFSAPAVLTGTAGDLLSGEVQISVLVKIGQVAPVVVAPKPTAKKDEE
jgi:hypothetical protein